MDYKRHQLVKTLLIFLAFIDISVQQEYATIINNETLLIEQLFVRYNPTARPLLDTSESVDINMYFQIGSLKDVDIKSQTITVNGWIRLMWTDERLRWNSSEYNLTHLFYQPQLYGFHL